MPLSSKRKTILFGKPTQYNSIIRHENGQTLRIEQDYPEEANYDPDADPNDDFTGEISL
jgi:hypothetical protein